MASAAYKSRKHRESVSRRIGRVATRWIWERDGHSCTYCGCALVPGYGAHLDHLDPRSNGGPDTVTNLVLACTYCNSLRKNLSLTQWAAYAAVTRGISVDPESVLARARTPVPREKAGRGRAWVGCPIA